MMLYDVILIIVTIIAIIGILVTIIFRDYSKDNDINIASREIFSGVAFVIIFILLVVAMISYDNQHAFECRIIDYNQKQYSIVVEIDKDKVKKIKRLSSGYELSEYDNKKVELLLNSDNEYEIIIKDKEK